MSLGTRKRGVVWIILAVSILLFATGSSCDPQARQTILDAISQATVRIATGLIQALFQIISNQDTGGTGGTGAVILPPQTFWPWLA